MDYPHGTCICTDSLSKFGQRCTCNVQKRALDYITEQFLSECVARCRVVVAGFSTLDIMSFWRTQVWFPTCEANFACRRSRPLIGQYKLEIWCFCRERYKLIGPLTTRLFFILLSFGRFSLQSTFSIARDVMLKKTIYQLGDWV